MEPSAATDGGILPPRRSASSPGTHSSSWLAALPARAASADDPLAGHPVIAALTAGDLSGKAAAQMRQFTAAVGRWHADALDDLIAGLPAEGDLVLVIGDTAGHLGQSALAAEAFGIEAFRIDRRDQVSDGIQRLLAADGPCLAHVIINPKENVWPLVPPGKSNAEMMEGS